MGTITLASSRARFINPVSPTLCAKEQMRTNLVNGCRRSRFLKQLPLLTTSWSLLLFEVMSALGQLPELSPHVPLHRPVSSRHMICVSAICSHKGRVPRGVIDHTVHNTGPDNLSPQLCNCDGHLDTSPLSAAKCAIDSCRNGAWW